MINQTYAKILGFLDPKQAVGKYLGDKPKERREVIGVVGDFYQHSLHAPIKPMGIEYHSGKYNSGTFHIALKPQTANGDEWKAAIESIKSSWKKLYPDDDFDYSFFDESIAKFYESEQHTSKLLTWATGLSILISCLGLLGLAMFTTNLRTKEIGGAQKVLGATVSQIVTLLSTELVVLVLLSFFIVTPLAWWAMNKWMQNFADKTTVSWWIICPKRRWNVADRIPDFKFPDDQKSGNS